ncbi:MAG: HEAT repeat domain-containing protein [Planctomycetota bacterium]|nr:HEAT repeat domain-containing protein [Planctomycetota bacterium]
MWSNHKRLILVAGAGIVTAAILALTCGSFFTDPAARAAQPGDTKARLAAINEIAHAPSAKTMSALAPLTTDADTQVSVRALETLGRMRRVEAVEPMKAALKDPRPETREAGVIALGRLGARGDPEALVQALRTDAAPEVRAAAVTALGLNHDWSAMPDILRALEDESDLVRAGAASAVRRLWQRDFFYRPDDPPQKRAASVARIRDAWEEYRHSPMAQAAKPLKEARP